MNPMTTNEKIWKNTEQGPMRMTHCESRKCSMPNILYKDLRGKKFHTQALILNTSK
jgi:hypothetical protein